MSNYKKLDVWIISMELVKEVYHNTRLYPIEERFGITSQTNRAVVSIPSNIAEGLGRHHLKDTIHFLFISRGSAYEVETLLNIAFMLNLINEESFKNLNILLEKNIQVINGFIRYLELKV